MDGRGPLITVRTCYRFMLLRTILFYNHPVKAEVKAKAEAAEAEKRIHRFQTLWVVVAFPKVVVAFPQGRKIVTSIQKVLKECIGSSAVPSRP